MNRLSEIYESTGITTIIVRASTTTGARRGPWAVGLCSIFEFSVLIKESSELMNDKKATVTTYIHVPIASACRVCTFEELEVVDLNTCIAEAVDGTGTWGPFVFEAR